MNRVGSMALIGAVAPLLWLGACSGRLSHDVLVPVVSTYVAAKTVTLSGQDSRGEAAGCVEEFHEFLRLPSGETYGLNVDGGGWFAQNELSVSFYESGALKEVTLGSDPQADETLGAAADLVKELGSVATSAVAARTGCPTKNVETRESVRCVLPFAEWQANGYRCDPSR